MAEEILEEVTPEDATPEETIRVSSIIGLFDNKVGCLTRVSIKSDPGITFEE